MDSGLSLAIINVSNLRIMLQDIRVKQGRSRHISRRLNEQKQQDMMPGKENQHLPQKLDYFECPICAQCFTTFSDIESHMKLKHQKQITKPYYI